MATKRPKGSCGKCGRELTRGGAPRHLQSCLGPGPDLLLTVASPKGPWWMVVAAQPGTTFGQLDQLLRDTWLECCGHMSDFELGRHLWLSDQGGMDLPMDALLKPGATFTHVYDFGTSTHLAGKLVGRVQASAKGPTVVMRNHDIAWPCNECGEPATRICRYCDAPSCGCTEDCPDCGEFLDEMSLPVVNSPRMGVCGYTG